MKYTAFFILFSICLSLRAQENVASDKGATPVSSPLVRGLEGVSRAVVIGISDYKDDRIPNLRYAHVDAQAFATYLQSTAGGSLPDDRIQLLTNEQATAGKIIAALGWLIEESKPADRAIIYFSGHGDVERLTKFQRGYLLAHDAPGTTYMAGGSLPIGALEDIITTLSEAGVQVVVISDACRSGKLAGSSNGGPQATTEALALRFANEIKILSCQPDEFSLEGEQWGGGRGCFSYHLVDALTGLADGNADGSVNLLETDRYLEDHVLAETAPQKQIPMTFGDKSTVLATVDPAALAALREQRKAMSTLSPIDAKGFESMVLAQADSTIQELYAVFTAALERGELMSPTGASANDYYEQLLQLPGIEKLKGLMTRNLAAALQDEAQVVINQLLRTDPAIVDEMFSPVSKYDHLPAYLHRAADLLGARHYMYRFIKAREYYFQAKTCRAQNYPDLSADSLRQLSLEALDTALRYDSLAAYVYMEKGLINFFAFQKDSLPNALEYFNQAHRLSPQWVLPICFLSWTHGSIFSPGYGNFDHRRQAVDFAQLAISVDSSFLPGYRMVGDLYYYAVPDVASEWYSTYINKMQEYIRSHSGFIPIKYYNDLGNCLWKLYRYQEAEEVLLKGLALAKEPFFQLYINLASVAIDLGKYADTERYLLEALKINPSLERYVFSELASLRYFYMNQSAQAAIAAFREQIEVNANDQAAWEQLTFVYLENNQLDSAEQVAQEWVDLNPSYTIAEKYLAKIYLEMGAQKKAGDMLAQLSAQISKWPTNSLYYYEYRVITDFQLGRKEALNELLEAVEKDKTTDPKILYRIAIGFAFNNQTDEALQWLERAFSNGWQPMSRNTLVSCLYDINLFELRKSAAYKQLLVKYFPGQVVDR